MNIYAKREEERIRRELLNKLVADTMTNALKFEDRLDEFKRDLMVTLKNPGLCSKHGIPFRAEYTDAEKYFATIRLFSDDYAGENSEDGKQRRREALTRLDSYGGGGLPRGAGGYCSI